MMRNGQDGVAVFGPAIAALEQEAHELDRRAAAARALIQQLRDHAGVTATVKVPPRQTQTQVPKKPNTPKAAAGGQQAAKPAGRTRPAPGVSAAGTKVEAVAELKKLIAEVAKLDGLIKAEKDAAAIKKHIAALLRAERRGGEILVALAGKVKVPVSRPQRQRWRQAAALAPKQFEMKLERTAKLAIAALDGGKGGDQKSRPSQPVAPKLNDLGVAKTAQPKRPDVGPGPPVAKLTAWHTDETGALSRELSAT